ncbi:hypothetical protein Tco_0767450 [Tanacetum coccineum]
MLFDNTMKWVDSFVPIDTEVEKGSKIQAEGISKRTGEELESDNSKKQKIDENVEVEVDDEAKMKKLMEIVPDDEEVILFYNGLDIPTRQILDSKGAMPSKTTTDVKIAIQEMAEYSHKWHNGTFDGLAAIQAQLNNLRQEIKKVNEKVGQYKAVGPGFYQRNNGNSSYPDRRTNLEESLTKFMEKLAKRHEENSNIIKEIRASTDAAIRYQGASIKTLEIQIE